MDFGRLIFSPTGKDISSIEASNSFLSKKSYKMLNGYMLELELTTSKMKEDYSLTLDERYTYTPPRYYSNFVKIKKDYFLRKGLFLLSYKFVLKNIFGQEVSELYISDLPYFDLSKKSSKEEEKVFDNFIGRLVDFRTRTCQYTSEEKKEIKAVQIELYRKFIADSNKKISNINENIILIKKSGCLTGEVGKKIEENICDIGKIATTDALFSEIWGEEMDQFLGTSKEED